MFSSVIDVSKGSKFGSPGPQVGGPLYRQEQTSSAGPIGSEKCQQQISRVQCVIDGTPSSVALRLVVVDLNLRSLCECDALHRDGYLRVGSGATNSQLSNTERNRRLLLRM